jgi:hypothetical protein
MRATIVNHFLFDAGDGWIHAAFVTEAPAPPDLSPSLAPPLDISKCLELSRRLAGSMQTLRDMICKYAGRELAASAVMLLLWPYLNRVAKRFEALVGRVETGRASVRTRVASLAPRARPSGLRRPGLPTGFAWLCRLLPCHAACVGGQVRHLLVQPEMAALFLAAPQVGRIFRPLCRMLAIAPGPDLPPGLFKKCVRREKQASALTPALSPKREREKDLPSAPDACGSALTPALSREREREKQTRERDAGLTVSNWSIVPRRRAGPRLPAFRAAPA